jgi:hypothetical protein
MCITEIPPSQMASSGNVYFCQLQQHFLGVFLAQEILQWANSYSRVQNRAVCLLNANEQ